MLGVGGRRRWEAGNAGRWWEAEGVLEKKWEKRRKLYLKKGVNILSIKK